MGWGLLEQKTRSGSIKKRNLWVFYAAPAIVWSPGHLVQPQVLSYAEAQVFMASCLRPPELNLQLTMELHPEIPALTASITSREQ